MTHQEPHLITTRGTLALFHEGWGVRLRFYLDLVSRCFEQQSLSSFALCQTRNMFMIGYTDYVALMARSLDGNIMKEGVLEY